MVEQLAHSSDNILGFELSGRLHDQDYVRFVPVIESTIENFGAIRLLAKFADFRGWDPHALWDDIRFSSRHCHDVQQIALVGDKAWERWMAGICKPFTGAAVRYFDISELEAAWGWLESGNEVASG